MNLGELIVDLSLDYAEFNQSLEQAKKAASNAAASIEKSFQKLSLTIEVDDSALYDLNKHLDLKYRHFREVNQYFKNNPLTPTVDDGELTELNKTLKELTQNKHTVTIEQRINAKLTDTSKRDIAKSVTDGVADGVEKGVSKGLDGMEDMIAKAVADGIKAGSKSFSGGGSSGGSKKQEGIEDIVGELKSGFGDLQKQIGNQLIGDALKTVLKPAKDLITGFSEGISNDLGKQVSKGLQDTFAKQLGMDFKKMGEQAGNNLLGAFGIKVKKENKLLTAISDGSQIAVKSLGKSVQTYAVSKLNKALTDSLDSIFSELFKGDFSASSKQKATATAQRATTASKSAPPSTEAARPSRIIIPIDEDEKPTVVQAPLNIPVVKKPEKLPIVDIKPKAQKVLLENTFTPFEKAAHESNKNFGYVLEEIGNFNVKGSPVGGGNQTVKRVANEITKIKTAHQKAYSTFKNLLESAKDLGDYDLADQIYRDFTKNSETAKAKIDELLKEGQAAGLKQKGFNKLRDTKAPITRSVNNIRSAYFTAGRQAEGEAAVIGKNVVAGLGIGVDNKAFAKFGIENATAYLLAIKKAFGIASPAKNMIPIGVNILQGLSIGLQQGLGILKNTVEGVTGTIKKGLQIPNLIPSESIKSFDAVIENSLGGAAQATKNVYESGRSRTTLPGVILGNMLSGAVNMGIVPKSIATPVRHLGAFYQGATDVNRMNPQIAKEAEILTVFRMIEEAQKSKGVLPDSGVVPSRYGAKLPDTRYTLGGFNYNQNKQGGLNINDVYDWADDDSLTPFKLPKDMGSKIFKLLQKHSGISKLLGFKLEDLGGEQAFTKTNSEGKALFSFINSKNKDFALGHAFHNMVGGKPYIQTHEVSARRTDELLSVGTKAYKDSKGDLNKFLLHPEIQKQLKQQGDQIGENLPNAFVSGFSKGRSPMLEAIHTGFSSVIGATKAVFQIASPSKVMQSIGLDFGKGFENGAVASLVLANKRIADLILKTVNESETATEYQKASAANYAANVEAENNRISKLVREGKYSNEQASQHLAVGVKYGKEAADYTGVSTSEIPKILQQAKRDVTATSVNMQRSVGLPTPMEMMSRNRAINGIPDPWNTSIGYGIPNIPNTSSKNSSFVTSDPWGTQNPHKPSSDPNWVFHAQQTQYRRNNSFNPLPDQPITPIHPGQKLFDNTQSTFQNLFQTLLRSFTDTQKQGNATLGVFISNALRAGGGSLLGSAGIGASGMGSILRTLTSGNTAALIPQLLPLLVPILGLKGLNLGDTIVKILNNNLAIKPGFLNDLFKSLTGIKLEKTGFMSAVTNTLGISKGSKSPITSPMEVITKQISANLGGVGASGNVSKLVENTGQMLVSAVLKQFGVSGAVGVAIEAMVKGRIANFANLGIFTNTGGKGIGGRVRGIAESYAQGDVEGVIGKSSKLAGTILRTIGFKVDMKQLTLVMGTAIAGITAFHKAFAEEGLGLGQALLKGFKEAQKNWGNAFDDMKIKAKQAMGMDVLGDLTGNIIKKIKQGTVVSRETFSDFFDEIGKTFKNKALKGDKEGVFGNILGFGASISTMIAPITTIAASLLPLLIPLMPLMGALGGLAVMVGGKIAGLANAIKEVEPLQRRLNFLGGSPAGGEREMKYAQGVANRLNVPVREGIQAYSQLAIAARGTKLEGDGVRELYEGISASLSALGINGQDAGLVFMAYTQILAKGKLSMEELRQQLGEKFPPAMGVFAKSMGVSVAELGQLISKGAILSEDILPKVAKTLSEDYGKSAANGTASFTSALTKLGNIGFDIAIKLTKAFGGTFAMFTNFGAGLLGIFRDALDQIIPLFNSLMIGVTAVVGVGLAVILQSNPIAKFLTNMQTMITVGLGKLMLQLAPFYIGIIADVADGWLGAQNDLMDNMMKGVGSMAVAMATALDNLNRAFAGKSLFSDIVGKKEAGNPFQGMIDGLGGLFRIIPSGVVELGALVLMFEQVQTLAKLFLFPTGMNIFKGFGDILGNFAGMLKPIGTIIPELFVNTFDMARNADEQRKYTPRRQVSPGQGISNVWSGFTKGVDSAKTSVTNFGSNVWDGFTQGIDRAKNSMSQITWTGFVQKVDNTKSAVKTFGSNVWNGFTQGIDRAKNSLGTILTPLTALFSGDKLVRQSARSDWGNIVSFGINKIGSSLKMLLPIAAEAALALGVILFARSDFTNPVSDSIGKMATGINNAIKSINGSLDELANKFDNAGKSAKDMGSNLPSKGLELNIQYALGVGGKSFKSDDFINQANASEGFGGNIQRSLIRSLSGGLNNLNPIYNAKSLASILGYQETPESVKQNKIDADKYGIGKYFTGKETTTSLAQTQLLNQVKDIQLNKDGLNKFLSETGLTAGTDFSTNVKQAANQVRELDKQLFSLGQKRSKLGLLNTSASKIQIAELDKQLMALEKQRGVAAEEIVNIDAQAKEIGVFDPKTGEIKSGWLKDTMDAIRDNKEMPLDVRMKLIADLKPMEDAIRTASQKIAKLPVDPLKEVYTQTINSLRDFELVYERSLSGLAIQTANRQEALNNSNLNPGNFNRESSRNALEEQEARKAGVEAILKIRERTLNNLNSITGFGKTDEQKKELEDLRKNIRDDKDNLAKLGNDISKAKRDIRQTLVDQTKQVADYYRTATREAQAVSIEFQKAQKTLENSRMQNKLREALIGAGDNIYTQFIEGIINIISQTTEIEKQQLEARKQRVDYENNVQDIQLQASELQRNLPGKIIPLDSSVADNFNLSLEEIDGTVETINSSVKNVASSLSNDVVEAAKKANAELDKLNQSIQDLDNSSNSWIEGFGGRFAGLFNVFENGFDGIGNKINDLQVKTATWLGSISNAPSLLQNVASGVQSAVTGIFGKEAGQQLEQGTNQLGGDPVGAITNFLGANKNKIFSPIQGTTVEDLLRYKPTRQQGFYGSRDRGARQHSKIDFDSRAKAGQDAGILASLPGVATSKKWTGNSGGVFVNSVLPSGQKITLEYGHLSLASIKDALGGIGKQVQVQAGQKLGKVTMDALSTGAHLDFGVRVNGKYTDPQKFLQDFMGGKYGGVATGKQSSQSVKPVAQSQAPQLGGVLWGKAANYAPSDLSGLTARGKKAMAALQNPNVRAFLDAIAVAEVGTKGAEQGGYGYLIGDDIKGRESFDPNKLGSHPGRRVRYGRGRNQVSSATGRYQTMDFVAKEEFSRLGLRDFKPQSQEILAVSRLMYRGILDDIKKGNFKSVINRPGYMDASSEWASLAGNPYGQGSPTGKTNVFFSNIQRNLQALNNNVMQGRPINPNSQQNLVTQAGRLRLNTAAQQLETNQINSNLDPEQIEENALKQRLEAYRFIRSTRKSALGDISSTKDSTLGTQRTVLEGLSPNMSNADRFGIQLADLRRKIEKDIEALQQIIDDTDGAIAQKPDLQAAFNLAMKRFPNDPKLAADAIQTNDLTFKATAFRNAEAKNNLAFLKSNVDDILKASIADFDKKEFFRLSEQDIAQQTKAIEQLQQQLQALQKLDEIDPLNPLVLSIPALQKNIDLLSINRDQYQQLLDLQKRYYEGGGKGGNMSEDAFQKEFKAILNVNSVKKEGIDLNFNYADTVKRIDQATKELTKAQTIQSSQMKSLQLDNERFAIDNKDGMVSLVGLTNELTMKTNELTNAYKKQLLEIEGNVLLNKPGEKLREQLKANRNYRQELSNAEADNAYQIKLAELVTIPQAKLDASSKKFDLLNQNKFDLRSSSIETLKGGRANQFLTNRLTRELEIEKQMEAARRSQEQLMISINEYNLKFPKDAFNADQIKEMSAALDELNKKKLDDITKSAKTFDMAIKDMLQEQLISGFSTGIKEVILGTKSLGDALTDISDKILNGVLDMALNSLFSGLFGAGGVGGGLFGFSKGGKVPNFADGGVIGAISDAMNRERIQSGGRTPILGVFNGGERILNPKQSKRFEELQMERVLNYAGGGVVGSTSTPNMNFSAPSQSSTVNISVPVSVNGGQSDTSVNVPQLQNAVRSAVLAEIQKQQRPGGALNK